MKTRLYSILLTILFCALTSSTLWAEDASETVLRILCYNIKHGQGMDGKVDLARTASAIKQWNPDLVAVQEVDRNTQRVEGADQPKRLGEMLNMYSVFGKAIDYQGGEYGLVVLSRFPILEHEIVLLPTGANNEQRGVLITKIALPNKQNNEARGKVIRFASTHLSVASSDERVQQAMKITEILSTGSEPTIVAGDFNAQPNSQPIVQFCKTWTESADPALKKHLTPPRERRIDYIFYRTKDPFEVLESRTIEDKITSDHLPIFSLISL